MQEEKKAIKWGLIPEDWKTKPANLRQKCPAEQGKNTTVHLRRRRRRVNSAVA